MEAKWPGPSGFPRTWDPPRETKHLGSMEVAQEYKWMDDPDCEHHAPTLGLELVYSVTPRRLERTRITLWESLTSGVHTSMQSLYQRRSSNFLTSTTSTLGQDAAEEALLVRDETGCKVVTTWNRERNQSGRDGDG